MAQVPQVPVVFQAFRVIQTKLEDLNRIQQNLQPVISQIQRALTSLITIPFTNVRDDYQAQRSDKFILADSRNGAFNVVLPKSDTMIGAALTVKRGASANVVTVKVLSGDSLDAGTSFALTAVYSSVSVVATESGWVSFASV